MVENKPSTRSSSSCAEEVEEEEEEEEEDDDDDDDDDDEEERPSLPRIHFILSSSYLSRRGSRDTRMLVAEVFRDEKVGVGSTVGW
jgi:hypothetical protein